MAPSEGINSELIRKLSNIPPLKETNSRQFQVNINQQDIGKVSGGSFYEVALKISLLCEFVDTTDLEVRDTDCFVYYRFTQGKREPELLFLEKINPLAGEVLSHAQQSSSVDNCDQSSECNSAEGDGLLDTALSQYFGFPSFRPLQKETITSILKGENVLSIAGTGGGKSLMFMLPAVLSTKPTLVISPVKSLIDDLLVRCMNLDIQACKFTGEVPRAIQQQQLSTIQTFKIILATPEVLLDEELGLSEVDFERLVFYEAHTIVTWGSTFRPEYLTVCESLAKLQVPKLLLSATVPGKLQEKLKAIFGELKIYSTSVFRDNLRLEVRERSAKQYDDICEFLAEHEGDCGIVYCVFPSDVAKVHAELIKRQIQCVKYHGQLSQELKTASYGKWIRGEAKVMVANAAFGMGIDKGDVRFVLHARTPTSIDEYFQQCGRAGRDGLASVCRLFYSYGDKLALCRMFFGNPEYLASVQSVNELIEFLENPVHCRHRQILSYFGEQRDNFRCLTSCDNCESNGKFQITDGTVDAVKVVQALVQLTGKTLTCSTLKSYLAGSRQKAILEAGLDNFSTFGTLNKKVMPTSLLEKFLHLLIFYGILEEKPIQTRLGGSMSLNIILGPKAHDLLALGISVIKYVKR